MNSKEMNRINWKEYIKKQNKKIEPLALTVPESSLRCCEKRRQHMTEKIEARFGKSIKEF